MKRTFAGRAAQGNSARLGAVRRASTAITRRSGWWIPAALAVLSYALAFAQRPGQAYSDSRAELTVDPGLFIERVTSVWSNTADLGHLQSGQFVGYLSPMAPWFAGADALGIPLWIAERVWLGSLMALAGWGVVRLLDALYDDRRGWAHGVAGLLYAVNPYVVVYASRGTVTLLAYTALPWLMLAACRGLAEPRRWRWPLAAGVVFALAAGGVNAAVVFWILVAPGALILYEVVTRRRALRDAWRFGWRAAVALIAWSLWWVVPVFLQGSYGSQFLSFTEQPDAIWATTSMSESLRLLGYWVAYVGTGYGISEPTMEAAATYLFSPVVIVACFAVPLFAFGGLPWTRRWTYAPFFALLAVGTLLVMAIGFPEGKPLTRTLTSAYYEIEGLQFLRTTYKAAPLLALSLACLAGASASHLVAAARARTLRLPRIGRAVPAWALLPLLVLPVLWAAPLFTGRAVDRALAYDQVPQSWRAAVRDGERETPGNTRMLALPGQLFGFYRWGRTLDPLPPALSSRPILARQITRYSDPRASQLQATIDDTIQQQRLLPGQLPPLLRLLGVANVLVATDGRPEQSGELDPAQLDAVLRGQPGFERPAASYGPRRQFAPAAGRGGDGRTLPELRRYTGPPLTPGVVRIHPQNAPLLLEGDGEGVVEAAGYPRGLEALPALFYAGDLDADGLRKQAAAGGRIVFTDSNRRRSLATNRITENRGPTVGPDDPLPRELVSYDLFDHGSDDQTVAEYSGLRYLRSPRSPSFAVFPEQRPFAAFDGRLDRSWIASGQKPGQRWIEAKLAQPRAVGAIRVYPHDDALGRTEAIGISVNGGAERRVGLHRGWNAVRIGATRLETLRLRVAKVHDVFFTGRGGLAEVQIPGLPITERLRLPTHMADSLRGADLSRNRIEVLLQRTTADVPYRAGSDVGDEQAESPVHMVDAEAGVKRRITLPSAREFRVEGWASVSPSAADPDVDRLTGMKRDWRFASSSRFEGVPGQRASSAFDASTVTSWVGDWLKGDPAWIAFSGPRPVSIRRLRLRGDLRGIFAAPAHVRLTTDEGRTRVLRVGRDGFVTLPRRVRTRRLRIDIVDVVSPAGLGGARLLSAVAIGEVAVPGLDPPRARDAGPFVTPCGGLTFNARGSTVRARAEGTIEDVNRGAPLRIAACGSRRSLALAPGPNDIDAPAGRVVRADHVRLVSPGSGAAVPASTGRVAGPADVSGTKIDGVRLALSRPSWLVLAQSYSPGWRAWCSDRHARERDLGEPEPADGYGNGWRVPANCTSARFAFTPQRAATASYVISGLAGLAVALLVAAGAWRRRRDPRGAAPTVSALPELPSDDPVRRAPWPAIVGAAVLAGVVGGYVFAWRAGVGITVATLLFGLLGITVRRLFWVAIAALAAVPVIYLVNPAPDLGGHFFGYAEWHLKAHWAATGAVCAVGVAALLDTLALRREAAALTPRDPDDAVPGQDLAQPRDAADEGEPRPVARLDAIEP